MNNGVEGYAVMDGYAVMENGKILIRTVSESERAAKINWLVAHANQIVYASCTDSDVDKMFDYFYRATGVFVTRVVVIRVLD